MPRCVGASCLGHPFQGSLAGILRLVVRRLVFLMDLISNLILEPLRSRTATWLALVRILLLASPVFRLNML